MSKKCLSIFVLIIIVSGFAACTMAPGKVMVLGKAAVVEQATEKQQEAVAAEQATKEQQDAAAAEQATEEPAEAVVKDVPAQTKGGQAVEFLKVFVRVFFGLYLN